MEFFAIINRIQKLEKKPLLYSMVCPIRVPLCWYTPEYCVLIAENQHILLSISYRCIIQREKQWLCETFKAATKFDAFCASFTVFSTNTNHTYLPKGLSIKSISVGNFLFFSSLLIYSSPHFLSFCSLKT